jgi:hypothetical protein
MLPLPQSLSDLAGPWAALYGDSKVVSDGVTFVHFAGLLVAGGAAVAVDRETLTVRSNDVEARGRGIAAIRAVHRWVLIGLGLTVVSGLGLVASDLKTYWGAPAYWVKMGLFALLLINGLWLQRTERRPDSTEPGPWTKLRWAAGISLALWFAILFTSILVTTAA